eukprot:2617097-Alexandrium_andersonii.AAC.1
MAGVGPRAVTRNCAFTISPGRTLKRAAVLTRPRPCLLAGCKDMYKWSGIAALDGIAPGRFFFARRREGDSGAGRSFQSGSQSDRRRPTQSIPESGS